MTPERGDEGQPAEEDAMRLFAQCSRCKFTRLMWVDPFSRDPQFCDECLAASKRTTGDTDA